MLTIHRLQCERLKFHPRVKKIPWRRKRQPTPVCLAGESRGRRSLVGYSPRGHKESDTTERLHFHFHFILQLKTTNCQNQKAHHLAVCPVVLPSGQKRGGRAVRRPRRVPHVLHVKHRSCFCLGEHDLENCTPTAKPPSSPSRGASLPMVSKEAADWAIPVLGAGGVTWVRKRCP